VCVFFFCIDEDNFIKSVTENWVQKILWVHFIPFAFFLFLLYCEKSISLENKEDSSSGEGKGFLLQQKWISFVREMDFFCELGAPSNLPFQSLPLLGASIKITASLRFLAVAAAASLSCPTACRRISQESGISSSERPPHPGQCTALPLMSARCSHQSCPPPR